MSSTEETVTILRGCELFSELDDKQLQTIAKLARQQNVIEGEFIFRDGSRAHNLYVIIEAKIALLIPVPASYQTLDILGPHGAFGIFALGFGRLIHPYAATALSGGCLLVIDGLTLSHHLELNPEVGSRVYKATINIPHRHYSRLIDFERPGYSSLGDF